MRDVERPIIPPLESFETEPPAEPDGNR